MTSDEVVAAYSQGGDEAFESTMVLLLPISVAISRRGAIKTAIKASGCSLNDEPPINFAELEPSMTPSSLYCFEKLRQFGVSTKRMRRSDAENEGFL